MEAEFRFYAELNDFLPLARRQKPFLHRFSNAPAIKDTIEALGVPHTEIDLILVNGVSVGFDHRLRDGNRVTVYPVFEGLDVTPLVRLRAKPLRRTRFVLDVHLGRLARKLRMLGFDSLHGTDIVDKEPVSISVSERRLLLTRDRKLLHRKNLTHGYWVRATRPDDQVAELLARFDLYGQIDPFTRCMVCNGIVERIDKPQILDRVPEKSRQYYHEFFICPSCGRVYWKGSHHANMSSLIRKLTKFGGESGSRQGCH